MQPKKFSAWWLVLSTPFALVAIAHLCAPHISGSGDFFIQGVMTLLIGLVAFAFTTILFFLVKGVGEEPSWRYALTSVFLGLAIGATLSAWIWMGPIFINDKLVPKGEWVVANPFMAKAVDATHLSFQMVWSNEVKHPSGENLDVTINMAFEPDDSRPEVIAAFANQSDAQEFSAIELSQARKSAEAEDLRQRIVRAVLATPEARIGKYDRVLLNHDDLAARFTPLLQNLPIRLVSPNPLSVRVWVSIRPKRWSAEGNSLLVQ